MHGYNYQGQATTTSARSCAFGRANVKVPAARPFNCEVLTASGRTTPLTKHKTATVHDTVTSYFPKPSLEALLLLPNSLEDRSRYLA